MKKIEIVNREVRDVTYEMVVDDQMYEDIKSLSPDELLQFIEQTESQWQLIDWGLRRINTPKGLNIQRIDSDRGRRVTRQYEELYEIEKHERAIEEKALPSRISTWE